MSNISGYYWQVLVYQLKGMPEISESQEQVLERIMAASLASQLPDEETQEKSDALAEEADNAEDSQ